MTSGVTAEADRLVPHRPCFWDRASAGVKDAVRAAREEARRRRKTYLGTEHLLLGLMADPQSAASRALAACGADPEVVVPAVNGKVGVPSGDPLPDETSFTRLTLTVLQHSLRETLRTGGATVDTEHLALALLSVGDGVAHDVLINLAISYDRLRRAAQSSQ